MKIVKKNKVYFLNPENLDEEKKLEFFLNKSLNLDVKDSLFIASFNEIKKTKVKENILSVKKKIINLLNDKDLTFKDKVEGTFEKLLNKEDLLIFKEMIVNKEVEIFKLSDKYKKGVYQLTSRNSSFESKEGFDFFDTNNYIILKTSQDAKTFSQIYENDIKAGDVLGIKSFDGNYYVLKKDVFNELYKKIKNLSFNDTFSTEYLSSFLKISLEKLKVFIEILKEEGKVIEKKKNTFEFLE